jgi:phosphoribosylamine--glycine ligase
MGAYSPAEVVTPLLMEEIERRIVRPSVDAIAAERIFFCGTLFIGIMLTADGPKVLEFNTRFGDPETQAVLPRLETDTLSLLWAAATRTLGGFPLVVRPIHSICVVVSARGYPDKYPTGDGIEIPSPLPPGVRVLHAGTARNAEGRLVTAGGRVLGVTATGPTLREAAASAYAACESIGCSSKYYRRDIGARQLRRL